MRAPFVVFAAFEANVSTIARSKRVFWLEKHDFGTENGTKEMSPYYSGGIFPGSV
jgi:hypothetical protein